jgi:hypothetical protein
MTTTKTEEGGGPGEGPTDAPVSSDLPDQLAALGTQGTPNDGRHWSPGGGAIGSRLTVEAADRYATALAAALRADDLAPAARTKLIAEVNKLMEPAGLAVIDALAPTGPDSRDRALAAADALADVLAVAPLNPDHRSEIWNAAHGPLRRQELHLGRTDRPARPERPPRP